MAAIADPATFYYQTQGGTVTFPIETETLGCEIKPILDQAKRTVIANQYSLKIKTYVIRTVGTVIADTEVTMDSVRAILTTPGGSLSYANKGLGVNFSVNLGGKRDVAWGPIPTLLSWKPVAGKYACEVTWGVDFQTLDCQAARFQFGIMAFNYKVRYERGHDNLEHAVITGYLQIPQTRIGSGNRFLSDSADQYLERVTTPIPLGFRRESAWREVSEDKNRLDFGWTDVMLKAPLPVGMVDFDLTHNCATAEAFHWIGGKWSGSISASYEVALGWDQVIAWLHFGQILQDRLQAIDQAPQPAGPNVALFGKPFPMHVTSSVNPMTRKSNFSCTYMRIMSLEMITDGVYRDVPDQNGGIANYAAWATSLQAVGATLPRGYAGFVLRPQDDLIIDLCGQNPPSLGADLFQPNNGISPNGFFDANLDCPDPAAAWVHFRNHVVISWDDNIIEHKPLPTAPLPTPQPPSLGDLPTDETGQLILPSPYLPYNPLTNNAGQNAPSLSTGTLPGQQQGQQGGSLLQRRAPQRVYIWMIGEAVRACYKVPTPGVLQIGGQTAYQSNRIGHEYFHSARVGNNGMSLYAATWVLRWVLPVPPNAPIDPPNSPFVPDTHGGLSGEA